MNRWIGILVLPWLVLLATQCKGSDGAAGRQGQPGLDGTSECNESAADQGTGLRAAVTVSTPANGQFFAPGERPQLTVRLADRCDRQVKAEALGSVNLYLYGPRAPTLTRTASKLLNCVTDREASDRQHHYINLRAPHFAKDGASELKTADDGTITYTLAEVSDELKGTYTAGVWAVSQDQKDQVFARGELQLGTADVESYASGPAEDSSCADCHQAPSGRFYMHHSHTSDFAPLGFPSIDSAPIANCKSCHNLDGYSPNPIVRKVHGVHRGEHLAAPGVKHPEYGLDADPSLAAYTNVSFPAMPDGEKNCVKCHQDDRWKTSPSRLACGTCHDNVFFDTGAIVPARSLGVPPAGRCGADSDCVDIGQLATCNTTTGACERRTHFPQADDQQCKTCHSADESGVAPIANVHAILSHTETRGLQFKDFKMTGGSGPNGAFMAGDRPALTFRLTDRNGAAVTDLATNRGLSGTVIVSGPTDDRQRIAGPIAITAQGILSGQGDGVYQYVLPSPLPAEALAPLNTDSTTAPIRPNPAGTYTLWLYVLESLTVQGRTVRDAANIVQNFSFGGDGPIRPRQVITNEACNSCHVQLSAHGGSRRVPEACSLCHTKGASDRTVGAIGAACSADAQCRGASAGWESCKDTNSDGTPDACVVTTDPTPDRSIQFPVLIHDLHFARLREGYAERSNLVNPGRLSVLGYSNTLVDLSEILFPIDIRNCQKCHADSGAACSATEPCGIGQECRAGLCVNRAWTAPSARICLSCHDSSEAFAHAAINTWDSGSGPIESCGVCHGENAEFSVEKVHDVASYGMLPLPRSESGKNE